MRILSALLLLPLLLLECTFLQAATKNGFDLSDALIPAKEVLSGGPPRDGIPAINQPKFESVSDATWLRPDDRVLALVVNDEARAYPIRILDWHEIVNDKVGDQHFVVTYCPLCGTGMVFASNIAESVLSFGVSGLLYNSDVLLYDRNSNSLWSQIMGKAVSGPLKGTELPQLPAAHTTWKDWINQHPETLVLSRETGFPRNYTKGPYTGYEKSRSLYFKVSNKAPRQYHPKERVLGLEINHVFKAYPFVELSENGQISVADKVGGTPVEIRWNEAAQSAEAYTAEGTLLPSVTAFWFAWYTFHPNTDIYIVDSR